jgi:hypothetical protein
MKRPKKGEFAPFHETYLKALPSRGTAKSLLKNTMKELNSLVGNLTDEQANYRYEPGKWSIKEMLMHMIDTERVFAYRTLSFMRRDPIALPGFHQDLWMDNVDVANRSIKDLLKEFKTVRDNTLNLLAQCTEEQSRYTGTASNWKTSVRAYFYIIPGHQLHHMKVLREKYGFSD